LSKTYGQQNGLKLAFVGKDFLHPTFLNMHPTKFSISENVLYSENENPELKIIHSRKVDPKEIIMFQK